MKSCCVFCGSSPGKGARYLECATALGTELAAREIRLIYGGAAVGLMGAVADAVLSSGGSVTGVIPEFLAAKEIKHHGLTELEVVGSMHERKSRMVELSEGFIALPGGMGTFEELLEILTWAQLGAHNWPCGLLNVDGYYDALLAMLDRATEERFLRPQHRDLLRVESTPEALLESFARSRPPKVEKWLDRDAT